MREYSGPLIELAMGLSGEVRVCGEILESGGRPEKRKNQKVCFSVSGEKTAPDKKNGIDAVKKSAYNKAKFKKK